ncbi:tryptase-related [Holotrichia oblita]|uniref:Tryptase-related n=1 Tax=Holotrichia oblita TaxID=644536 RepID=A0ACB9TKM9_HOLOL|nr:tryptase-related [Holotrichia oblita]
MKIFSLCVIFVASAVKFIHAQNNQGICVPTGTCPPAPTSTPVTTTPIGIDPRIVTPGSRCPAGQELCTTIPCGTRYVNASTANGIAPQGANPWIAYITNQTGYTGIGVLLDSTHVLTVAHKVNLNVGTPSNVRLSFGVYNPSAMTNVQTITAAAITLHPSFNAQTLMNDIAVITLASPVTLGPTTGINVACLPSTGQSFVGQSCLVAGWGQTAFGANDAPTTPQKQVTVPIVDYNTCRASMAQPSLLGTFVDRYLDPAGEICAGGTAQLDACTQDGGSPLMCFDATTRRYIVAGLVTWGKKCALAGVYGVYVSVPSYRSWIDSVVINQSG